MSGPPNAAAPVDLERRVAEVWDNARPIVRPSAVTSYLESRGVNRWPLPAALRWQEHALPWECLLGADEEPVRRTALVAAITNRAQAMAGVVRFHFNQSFVEGRKPSPRAALIACRSLYGCAVALGGPERGALGLAGDVFSALLAWQQTGVPTWAAYRPSEPAIRHITWPAGVRHLFLFVDDRPEVRLGVERLAAHAARAGVRCELVDLSTAGRLPAIAAAAA